MPYSRATTGATAGNTSSAIEAMTWPVSSAPTRKNSEMSLVGGCALGSCELTMSSIRALYPMPAFVFHWFHIIGHANEA